MVKQDLFAWLDCLIWLFSFLRNPMFPDACFDKISGSGYTFLMKLRSGGLLFREKGSMGDFRGLGGLTLIAITCSWAPWGSILGGIFDQTSINNRCDF